MRISFECIGTAHRNRGRIFMKIMMDYIHYELHLMVDIVGIDKFLEICKMYGGNSIYIPVHRKVVMGDRNRKIVQEYNGKNLKYLSRKYNMSNQHLKGLLKKEGVI